MLLHMNSYRLAQQDASLTYFEGVATTNAGPRSPIFHAWCVDGDGRVIDPTWEHLPGSIHPHAYRGFPLPMALVEPFATFESRGTFDAFALHMNLLTQALGLADLRPENQEAPPGLDPGEAL